MKYYNSKRFLSRIADGFGRAVLVAAGVFTVGAALTASAADWTDANNVTYTALKSINGNASGYINTGIIPAGTEGVRFKYKPTTLTGSQCIYCSRWKSGNTWKYYFTGLITSSKFRIDRAKTQSACNTTGVLTGGKEYSLFANYNKGTITINGNDESGSLGTDAYDSGTPFHPLMLLGGYTGGGSAASPTVGTPMRTIVNRLSQSDSAEVWKQVMSVSYSRSADRICLAYYNALTEVLPVPRIL